MDSLCHKGTIQGWQYIDKMKKRTENKILGSLAILLSIVIAIKILIPIILSILILFLGLLLIWSGLTDINFKFIGGCFFLIVFYHIYSSLFVITSQIINKGFSLLRENKR